MPVIIPAAAKGNVQALELVEREKQRSTSLLSEIQLLKQGKEAAASALGRANVLESSNKDLQHKLEQVHEEKKGQQKELVEARRELKRLAACLDGQRSMRESLAEEQRVLNADLCVWSCCYSLLDNHHIAVVEHSKDSYDCISIYIRPKLTLGQNVYAQSGLHSHIHAHTGLYTAVSQERQLAIEHLHSLGGSVLSFDPNLAVIFISQKCAICENICTAHNHSIMELL